MTHHSILKCSLEGSLVITRAYPALYFGGTPSQETGTSPPSSLLLENRLDTSPDSHMKIFWDFFSYSVSVQVQIHFITFISASWYLCFTWIGHQSNFWLPTLAASLYSWWLCALFIQHNTNNKMAYTQNSNRQAATNTNPTWWERGRW